MILAATHSSSADTSRTPLDSVKFLQHYCSNTLISTEIDNYAPNVHGFLFSDESITTRRDDFDFLFTTVDKELPSIVSIVYLWSLDLPSAVTTDSELMNSFKINMYAPLYLRHSLIDASISHENDDQRSPAQISLGIDNTTESPKITKFIISLHSTLWVVTECVWCVEGSLRKDSLGLCEGTIWCLNRCLLNETGSLHPRAVDLSIEHSSILSQSEIDGLVTLLASSAYEA